MKCPSLQIPFPLITCMCIRRISHHRPSSLHELPSTRLQRDWHRQRLRRDPPIGLPSQLRLRRQQPSTAGPPDPDCLREQLLQEPRCQEGAPALRPGALQWRGYRPTCPVLCQQPERLLRRLRGGHDQDGRYLTAHRKQRRDQEELQEE